MTNDDDKKKIFTKFNNTGTYTQTPTNLFNFHSTVSIEFYCVNKWMKKQNLFSLTKIAWWLIDDKNTEWMNEKKIAVVVVVATHP